MSNVIFSVGLLLILLFLWVLTPKSMKFLIIGVIVGAFSKDSIRNYCIIVLEKTVVVIENVISSQKVTKGLEPKAAPKEQTTKASEGSTKPTSNTTTI